MAGRAIARFGLPILISMGVAFMLPGSALALHCPNGLVSDGDPEAVVRARCGPPAQVDTADRYVTHRVADPRTGSFVEQTEVVTVTVWIYNFGDNRLMQELEFRRGRLVDTRSLGYGH